MNCYCCPETLTEKNKSKEHIIPNSLGGKLFSYWLLCGSCNKKFGDSIDAELSKQLQGIAGLVGVARDRKKSDKRVKMIGDNGQVAYVNSEEGLARRSTLSFPLKNSDESKEILLNSDSPAKEAKRKKEEIESAFGKPTNLKIDEAKTKEKFWLTDSRGDGRVGQIYFGGEEYFRGIAKISLNYLLHIRPRCDYSPKILEVIKGRISTGECVFYYYPNHYRIHKIGENEISHLLHLVGDKTQAALYCYVELFNTKNFIVILNRDYQGDSFAATYCYNLLENQEVDKRVKVNLTRQHMSDMLIISDQHKARIVNSCNDLVDKIQYLSDQRYKSHTPPEAFINS